MSDAEDEDLLRLARMGFGGSGRRASAGAGGAEAAARWSPRSSTGGAEGEGEQEGEQEGEGEGEYDELEDTLGGSRGAQAAAAKFAASSGGAARKARRRAQRRGGDLATAAAAAAPAGAGDDDAAAAGPIATSAKHERKQQQQLRRLQAAAAAAAASSGAAASGGGLAEGRLTEAEQGLVRHALTQMNWLQQVGPMTFVIKKGHTKGMRVDARFFASPALLDMAVGEAQCSGSGSGGGFVAALQQLANVATLPGIVDMHSGYGFAIGAVAAVDTADPQAVVSPGGVGFDINCGVRLLRSNLDAADVAPLRDTLADALFSAVPVGVGSEGSLRLGPAEMDRLLSRGMAHLVDRGLCWPEDLEVTEEEGCFPGADPAKVSPRAKARGAGQCGTLGSGNHYVEVQVVDEVYDEVAAEAMGLGRGRVCVMIHSGSRGLGHQVCTDYLTSCDAAMARAGIRLVDRQLAAAPLSSPEGRGYLAAMAAAANFAFANRSLMARQVREAFSKVFGTTAAQLGLEQVYDVSHNIAKRETHTLPDGTQAELLVHRKGATRAFPPGHPAVPARYRRAGVGQPVIVGGSMGTASFVLTGTEGAMRQSFGSTCHGAGRALSRSAAMRELDSKRVLGDLAGRGVAVRIATKRLAAEEAPESYKDVNQVVDTCHAVGISRKCARLRPLVVIKG